MKRPTKHLSDVDLRGRVRRQPRVEQDVVPLTAAIFVDGPLAGQTLDVPRGADYVKVGPWTYSYAGKQPDNKRPLYAKMLKARAERRLLRLVIEKVGRDPRVSRSERRQEPSKRTAPPSKGRGARRRAEARKLRADQAAWRASDGYNGA